MFKGLQAFRVLILLRCNLAHLKEEMNRSGLNPPLYNPPLYKDMCRTVSFRRFWHLPTKEILWLMATRTASSTPMLITDQQPRLQRKQ